MHTVSYLAALGRAAPVQVTTHGNSVTSGHRDAVDYYVSFDSIETRAEGHARVDFTEQVVRLGGFHSGFASLLSEPSGGPVARSLAHLWRSAVRAAPDVAGSACAARHAAFLSLYRDSFGARAAAEVVAGEDGEAQRSDAQRRGDAPSATDCAVAGCQRPPVVLVPFKPVRLHPRFDAALAALLAELPCAVVGMLSDALDGVNARVLRRLHAAVAARAGQPAADAALRRIVLLPKMSHDNYVQWLALSDVVMDLWPYGGCTTSFEALLSGTPVVSLPSLQLRGRFTMAMLYAMQLPDLVVHSLDDLVDRTRRTALMLSQATERDRQKRRNEVRIQAFRAAQTAQPTHEWATFLKRAHRAAVLLDAHASPRGAAPGAAAPSDDAACAQPPREDVWLFLADPGAPRSGNATDVSVIPRGASADIVVWTAGFVGPDHGELCVWADAGERSCVATWAPLPATYDSPLAGGQQQYDACGRVPRPLTARNREACARVSLCAGGCIAGLQGSALRVRERRAATPPLPAGRHTLYAELRWRSVHAGEGGGAAARQQVSFVVE